MREPFALCRKAFATPLGPWSRHRDASTPSPAAPTFDPYADQFNHKREHSLEFQVVFLKHLLGSRVSKIVPVLAGSGSIRPAERTRRRRAVVRFLDGVRAWSSRARVASSSSPGPTSPTSARASATSARTTSEARSWRSTDRASLDHAASLDATAFWSHVARDLDSSRVRPRAHLVASARRSGRAARGSPASLRADGRRDDGSIVSHAALGFYA
jgi:AmmeMemoRadiSam system protein B